MEGIIFWLVPVILLVVFIIVALTHTRESAKPKLLLLEPVGTLIRSWHVARLIGDQKVISQAVRLLRGRLTSDNKTFEQIVTAIVQEKTAAEPPELLHDASVGLWGVHRVFATGGRTISLVVGNASDVLASAKYRTDGKSLLKKEDRLELEATAKRAGEHGYLALAVAGRYVHSRTFEPTDHSWFGLILLEPVFDQGVVDRLRLFKQSDLKLLSALPDEFLESLHAQVRGNRAFEGVPKEVGNHPRQKEERWLSSSTIGAANFVERYSAVRFLSERQDCRVVSANPDDRELPVLPTRQL